MRFKIYLAGLIAAVSFLSPADAANEITVRVNEKTVTCDVEPYINEQNRTMVPVYFVAASLGAHVSWEADGKETVTVTKDSDKILLKIGENAAYINGDEKFIDSPAVIVSERTFVPVRFIAEAFGADVKYDKEETAVIITYKDGPNADSVENNVTSGKTDFNRKRILNNAAAENALEVNVLSYGADPTGVKDSTSDIRRAHNSGKRVYYPNGTYIFNGKTLNFSGGVRFESDDGVIIRNRISDEPVVNFDDFGNLIGLQQNHLQSYSKNQRDYMEVGSLVKPPLSDADYDTKVDFMPMWYNDFGLESTRLQQYGSMTWYYWLWCYHNAGDGNPDPMYAYNPERHPLLGYYKGDDPIVLDWQCYWLREYGAKGVMLYSTVTPDTGITAEWENEASSKHWLYVLFNDVPNFKKMKYIMTLSAKYLPGNTVSDETTAEPVRKDWFDTIDNIYLKYDNCYCIEKDNKRYPTIYIHETKALPGVFDSYKDFKKTAEFFVEIAEKFKAAGYDGVSFICRHPDEKMYAYREYLEKNGVLFYDGDYSGVYSSGETYADLVENYAPPTDPNTVLNTATGHHTVGPHPSKWAIEGETPELFEKMVTKAVDHIYKYNLPRIISCYNVSEWSEGGPGLSPNMKNRFAYLDAFKNAVMR